MRATPVTVIFALRADPQGPLIPPPGSPGPTLSPFRPNPSSIPTRTAGAVNSFRGPSLNLVGLSGDPSVFHGSRATSVY